jgi:hypothetical protein
MLVLAASALRTFSSSSKYGSLPRSLRRNLSASGTGGIGEGDAQIILYDGVCNMCNGWVDLLLKLDADKKFTFSALQSKAGMQLLQQIGKDKNDMSSVVYIKSSNGDIQEVYFKSDAALKVRF